jgi:hypothetical protein
MGKINNRDITHLFASISYTQISFCCRNTQSNKGRPGEELSKKFNTYMGKFNVKKNGGISKKSRNINTPVSLDAKRDQQGPLRRPHGSPSR